MSLALENASESELIKQRGSIKSKLTHFTKFVQRLNEPTASELSQLQLRIQNVLRDFELFEQIQQRLEILSSDEMTETRYQERADFEDAFYNVRTEADNILKSSQAFNSLQGTATHSPSPLISQGSNALSGNPSSEIHVKLPTMHLPKFSGSCEAWPGFADAFKSAVDDNPNFRDVQKLIYLRSCLTGKAAEKIESLETTGINYSVAWNILEKYYNDPLAIIYGRVKAFFELPAASKSSAEALGDLVDSAERQYSALIALNKPFLEAFPIYAVTSKLDEETCLLWRDKTQDHELPTMRELLDFLHKRRRVLESSRAERTDRSAENLNRVDKIKTRPPSNNLGNTSRNVRRDTSQSYASHLRVSCQFCKGSHFTNACEQFTKASLNERVKMVRSAGLCYNCLRANHHTDACLSGPCKKCRQKHHTLLHFDRENAAGPSQCSHLALNTIATSQGILSTAIINILDRENKAHACRVLLDPGAQSHFLTNKFANKLQLVKRPTSIPVSCVNNIGTHVKAYVTASIQSRNSNYSATANFLLLPKITGFVPAQGFTIDNFQIPSHIELADPRFNIPAEIDAIIGVGLFYNLLRVGQISHLNGAIILQNTQLGWIVANNDNIRETHNTGCNVATIGIEEELAKFWAIEQGPEENAFTVEEKSCQEHYKIHTRREQSTGKHVVRLPFRDNASELDESYTNALKRFCTLERSLSRKQKIREQYANFTNEYLEIGHMPEINEPSTCEGYYLPQHAVSKQSDLTTKLRVAFHGSAKTYSGLSLISILVRFKSHAYMLTADIAKIHRQCMIGPRDREYQKTLWRENKTEPIKTSALNEAQTPIIKLVQGETFADTITTVSLGKPVKSNHASLSTFLDSEGMLRVGGRLFKSDLPYQQRHPALLRKQHYVSDLIIRENLEKTFHGGTQAALNTVRQPWLINGRAVIKRILNRCVTCRRARPVTPVCKMSVLPADRTQHKRPFLGSGADYCGRIFIKEKHHMIRVIGDTWLTYEALLTYVTELEAILNSRPITPLSADPNDLQALTPAHLLTGDSLTNIPERDYRDIPSGRLSCWQHIQQMRQHFCSCSSKEYLHEQTVRKKLHQNDPVDIKRGVIVTVRTVRGDLKRSVRKLSPLPIDTSVGALE